MHCDTCSKPNQVLVLTMKAAPIIAVKCKNPNTKTGRSKPLLARILQKCTAFIHIQTKGTILRNILTKKYSCFN